MGTICRHQNPTPSSSLGLSQGSIFLSTEFEGEVALTIPLSVIPVLVTEIHTAPLPSPRH